MKRRKRTTIAAVGCGLLQGNGELVVVIADLALLAPNRLPGFIEGAGVLLDDGESGGERLGVEKFEAHQARLEDDFAFVGQGIFRLTLLRERERQGEVFVGRSELLGGRRDRAQQDGEKKQLDESCGSRALDADRMTMSSSGMRLRIAGPRRSRGPN